MIVNRNNIPKPGNEPKFSLPKIEEFKTSNSFNIIFVHKDNLPIIRFLYISEIGSRIDPENQKGLINLFGMVMEEGAGGLNAIELKEEFQFLGTNFSIGTNKDSTSLSFLSLKENFERSLELVNLILNEPEFAEQSFRREKGKILTSLQQVQDSADITADFAFDSIIFNRNEPYAYPTEGYPDHINNLSIKYLMDLYKNIFKKTEPNLIIVGDISKDKLEQIVDDKLVPFKNHIDIIGSEINVSKVKTKIYFVDKKDSLQSEIRIGHLSLKRSENDFYSKALLNTILGGQFTSRLNLNLREDKGYTYGVHSSFSYHKYAGSFYVTTSVATEYTGSAISEIINEMKKIHQGVTKNELIFAKSSITKSFPSNFETYGQIASNLSNKIKHSLSNNYFANYLNKISDVTIDELINVALKNILPEYSVILIVGNKEKILPQLKDLKFGEVIEVGIFGQEL
ncbi:MAG: insulinase family protein [Bacteroidetes bacterium]|nr:insulinase family protein [Bacteroidota bacterium]